MPDDSSSAPSTPRPPAQPAADDLGAEVARKRAAVDRLKVELKQREGELRDAETRARKKHDAEMKKRHADAGAICFRLGLDEKDLAKVGKAYAGRRDELRRLLGLDVQEAGGRQ